MHYLLENLFKGWMHYHLNVIGFISEFAEIRDEWEILAAW